MKPGGKKRKTYSRLVLRNEALAGMIGWICGIRSPRTQSLLASLGFCCGFAASDLAMDGFRGYAQMAPFEKRENDNSISGWSPILRQTHTRSVF
jgi:hypothetical protein